MNRIILSGALVLAALVTTLAWGGTASAASRAEGQAYAANYCSSEASKYGGDGVGDYIWLTAGDGGNVIRAVYGVDNFVQIRIYVTGQYCYGYSSSDAGSSYWTDIGGVSGSFNYGNNGPNNVFDDFQYKWIDVRGWPEGPKSVCTDFSTWMWPVAPATSESVRLCTTLTLDIVYPWDTQGGSLVGVGASQVPNVTYWDKTKPGDTVNWRHRITNVTDFRTDRINFDVRRSGFAGGALPSGSVFLSGRESAYMGYNPTLAAWRGSPYVVTQNDVGKELCEWIHWSPGTYQGAVGDNQKGACVFIPYNFGLTPSVAPITKAAEPGTTITDTAPITPSVTNSGPTKSYAGTRWEVSRFILDPDATKPTAADNRTAPCSYYGGASCTTPRSGTQTFDADPSVSLVGSIASDTVDDLELGSQLCYGLSVTGYDETHAPNDGWWRHSVPQCVKVGKKPKVQIQGHDVAVRGMIDTSTTTKTASTFGSWVEYGAFSTGANSRFASGAGLVNQSSSAQTAWSALTFANRAVPPSCGTHGCYTTSANFRPLPGIASYFNAMQKADYNPGASLDANAVATGGPITVKRAGNLTLGAGSLSKGRTLVIIASGTVTITGDITYAGGGMTTLTDLPQLVIIARNINIEDRVQAVDAWLVTSDTTNGTVNTCSNVAPPLTGKVCDKPLTIHGPVVAGKLVLHRTAGSGTDTASGEPAETISLRPDAFLWARLVAGGAGKVETVSTVELPPRF